MASGSKNGIIGNLLEPPSRAGGTENETLQALNRETLLGTVAQLAPALVSSSKMDASLFSGRPDATLTHSFRQCP